NDFYTAATTTAKPRTTNTPFTTKVAPSAALPSKPKPNQPPLAMFMYNDDKQAKLTVSDALSNLKNVNNIAVLDSLSKNLPKVFIGPSGLAPPKGYSKFELPYLSSIDQNRLSAKPGDLPFFVAPQSYKTPGGFSKIPLPAPHVGSVIVQQPLIQSNYFRQPENIEYYQPSTLKFTDSTTKSPITLPVSKPQYESDHYTSPTSKPTTDRTNYSRGNTQTPQESYRQPQTERALFSHSPFNSVNTNRHIVNEEYFNLAKTKKPTTPSPTQSYTNDFTTQRTTTTTERPHTSRQEENRMKSFFKEENFRNRRPYTQSTVSTPYEEQEVTQPIRSSHENEGQFVHKFKLVDSVRPQTTPASKSFDEKSKQYEPEVTRFPQSRLQNQESFLNRFTETTYTNKYKYETNTDDAHYPVEVVTTQEPIRQDTSNDVTIPPSEQSYSIPSELPPISANLPGLVNSLMEDEWPHKKGEQDSSPPATTKGHFRKQIHRTTEPTTTLEPYTSEITTRRTRGRRPTTSSSSNYDSATPTRATTVNRSRSRYVAADGERSSGRTRTRSRPQSSSSRNAKEEENLEYQRDVLKQNYPVIRPTSGGVTTTTTTPAPPPPTTSTTTTHATTMPVTYQQIYEEQTERFNPYYSSPEPQNYSEEPVKYEEVSILKKDSYTENYYEPEITTTLPHTTYKQQYSPEPTTEEIDDESVRRPTTERTTTELPPSASSSRGSSVQRRPAFVRRPARPLYTTTPAPTTTYSSRGVRPKSRQDVLRGRTRRPVTTSAATTTTASPEPPVTRGYENANVTNANNPQKRRHPTAAIRIRERTRFNLQPQESQWSTKLTQNSFQPVQDIESRGKNYEGERTATEPEIEIVTASALQQNEEDVQLISVSANMAGGPTAPAVRERDQRNDKHGNDVLLKEVELSQEPPQAEENEENSNSPSFAELLNDVMKEYMDSNLQQGETDKKPVENEVLLEETKPVTSKSQRGSSERNPYNARANFRKRGRSHVVEAFEAAESQHINSHVYNTAGFESLKTIDKAALQGKNVNEAKGSRVVEEVTTTTTTTTTEAPVTDLPETTTFGAQDTTPLYETTSILPTEREVTTAVPTLEAQSENDEHQFSTEQFYDDEQDQVDDEPEDHQQGIFDDVKKQLSDLFAMA
ncbi:AAEL006888-PA, partial [Aedes aegypti]